MEIISLTVEKLAAKFPDSIVDVDRFRAEDTISIKKDQIIPILRFLKSDPELEYNFLADITAVDRLKLDNEIRFAVVYHLYSLKNNTRVRLKALVPEDDAEIDSAYSLWKTANWPEREVYDLFGITFNGHPDLRRILMPDNFDGHPLRKDYPLKGRGERDHFDFY